MFSQVAVCPQRGMSGVVGAQPPGLGMSRGVYSPLEWVYPGMGTHPPMGGYVQGIGTQPRDTRDIVYYMIH